MASLPNVHVPPLWASRSPAGPLNDYGILCTIHSGCQGSTLDSADLRRRPMTPGTALARPPTPQNTRRSAAAAIIACPPAPVPERLQRARAPPHPGSAPCASRPNVVADLTFGYVYKYLGQALATRPPGGAWDRNRSAAAAAMVRARSRSGGSASCGSRRYESETLNVFP